MDDIKQRLHDTSESCYNCYEAWSKNEKDSEARQNLQEAIHELRKVASRLEIELAVSESKQSTQKPISIPPHRDSRRRSKDDNDDKGNRIEEDGNGGGSKPKPTLKRRSSGKGPSKKASGE